MQNCVLEYFERGALAQCKQKIAVVDSEQACTFDELERFGKNCAALILRRTLRMNQPVAVFLPKCVQTIVANLGALYSGNCYANLDIKSPPERLKAMLENLGANVIITSSAYVAALEIAGVREEQLLFIEQAEVDDIIYNSTELAARSERVIDTDPLCIIHTSGSTGVPKGVALSHRGTIDFMDWVFQRFALAGNEIIGSLSPFYFDIYTLELFLCLAKGATLVIVPEGYAAFPVKLLDFMATQAISFIFWVPTIMVNIANQDILAKYRLASLKTIFFAGEVFPTKHLNYWRRQLPEAQFVNLYGPIEISVDCTYFVVDRKMADDEKLPIGFPCRNTDILILNGENQVVADNEPGELCVRGSSLALGYWNNPDLTARAFVQNPLNLHYPELIYRTGDLVYRNERGEIMFIGRKDYQVKHLGYRVELGEIEHAATLVAGIRNACIVYNEARKEITLFFESDEELALGAIRERLSAFVPKYMLPTICRRVAQLPRNPNGKIDRQALGAQVL